MSGLKCKKNSYMPNVRISLTLIEVLMTRTMTVDLGSEFRNYVESLVNSGDYKSNSEVYKN